MNIMKLTTDTNCRDVVKIGLVCVTQALQTVSVNCHSKAIAWTYHDFLVHIIGEDFVRTPPCPSVSWSLRIVLEKFPRSKHQHNGILNNSANQERSCKVLPCKKLSRKTFFCLMCSYNPVGYMTALCIM